MSFYVDNSWLINLVVLNGHRSSTAPLLSTNITAGFVFYRLYFTDNMYSSRSARKSEVTLPWGHLAAHVFLSAASRWLLSPILRGRRRPVLMAPRGKGCFYESATGDEPSDKKKQNKGAIGHRGSYYHIGSPERKLWRRLTRCKRDVRCFHSNKVNTLTAGVTAYQMDF